VAAQTINELLTRIALKTLEKKGTPTTNTTATIADTNCETISVTSEQNIQNMVSALCLMRNHDLSSDSEDSNSNNREDE